MKFINFRVIEFSIAVSGGILCANQGWIVVPMWKILSIFIFISIGIWIWNLKHLSPSLWNPFVNFICFFLIGFVNYQADFPEFQRHHFSQDQNYSSPKFRVLQITDVLKPSVYYQKYEAKCIPSNYDTSVGNVFLRIASSDCPSALVPDDRIILYGTIQPISDPKNPNPFDFKQHMRHNGIYHQITLTTKDIVEVKKEAHTLFGLAYKFRALLIQKLNQTPIETQEKSIIQALILGDKSSMESELYKTYASAGAVHILAVSGLHVGIVLLILNFLFRPLQTLPKGKWIKMMLIILALWTFAFIAGFSPSVVRAVTMFSLFTLADISNRPTNSINTLFLSYLLLLLIEPNWLFQVGFQLSYLAVASILWLQPKLSQLWRPRGWLLKKIWGLITVTIAAQIGVGPLSIYYFNQFPGMFLITNMVVLPFLALLLTYGLIVIVLASFDLLPDIFAKGYHLLIEWLNYFMKWTAAQSTFLFKNLSLSSWSVVFIYVLIISFLLALYQRKRPWGYLFLVGCILFLTHSLYEKAVEKNEWVLFHLYGKNLMALKNNTDISIYASSSQLESDEIFALKSYGLKKGKPLTPVIDIPKVFELNNDTYIILDSLGIYPEYKQAILVLTHNPKIHLDRLIEAIDPKLIIADGSNYSNYVSRWKSTCKTKQIPFYATEERGAYRMQINNP
jgi:competence protein ComEC